MAEKKRRFLFLDREKNETAVMTTFKWDRKMEQKEKINMRQFFSPKWSIKRMTGDGQII